MIGRLINGVIIVIIGAILLMNTTGYLPWSVWSAAVHYWPILVIGLGFQVALSKWKVPGLGLALIAVLILAAMNPYAGGNRPFLYYWRFWKLPRVPISRPLEHTKRWTVPLNPSRSSLELELKSPSMEVEASGDPSLSSENPLRALVAELSWDKVEPETFFAEDEGNQNITVSLRSPALDGNNAGKQVWKIVLNPSLWTEIDVTGGVADLSLDCDLISLKRITVLAGVSNINLNFGPSGKETSIAISSGVAKVTLKIPKNAGIQVAVSGPPLVTRADFSKQGLIRRGNVWTTPNYAESSTKIDVKVSCGAGKVTLERIDR